jgi:DeoR/GlpR family transcriptional regulator of sugar metabolism
MLALERRNEILETIRTEKHVNVNDLSDHYNVS